MERDAMTDLKANENALKTTTGRNRKSLSSLRAGEVISADMWLRKIPHLVFGTAETLPASTRLLHPCASLLHAKMISVVSKKLEVYFLKTFPLVERECPGPEVTIIDDDGAHSSTDIPPLPFYLVVNYSVNPMFVNNIEVPRGRSCVVSKGDIISFLECAFDAYGGVLAHDEEDAVVDFRDDVKAENDGLGKREEGSAVAGSSDATPIAPRHETRGEYCDYLVAALLREMMNERRKANWLVVEEGDFIRCWQQKWRRLSGGACQRGFSGDTGHSHITRVLSYWRAPFFSVSTWRCLYQSAGWDSEVVVPAEEDSDTDECDGARVLQSPIREEWIALDVVKKIHESVRRNPIEEFCLAASWARRRECALPDGAGTVRGLFVLPPLLPVYEYAVDSGLRLEHISLTTPICRLRCGDSSDEICYYYEEEDEDSALPPKAKGGADGASRDVPEGELWKDLSKRSFTKRKRK